MDIMAMAIRSEDQFEQLVDSVQTEVITTAGKAGKSQSQKMRDLIVYADSEKDKKEVTPSSTKK